MSEQIVSTELVGIVSTVASAASWLTWFIGNQFNRNRSLMYRIMSVHNKEDDDRFASISDDIFKITLRNAVRDGEEIPLRKTFPRRRYLQEMGMENNPEAS